MTRRQTPDLLTDVRAQTPVDDSGLAAMFGPVLDGERVQHIPLHALDDNPYQHRSVGVAEDDPDLIALATDIAQQGIIQPIVVRPHPASPSRYQIAAGHRRRLAAHLAGLESVPCVLRPLTDDQMLDVVFSENYHRADINPVDRALLIHRLVEQGMTQQQIAERLSMSRPAVSNALRLLQLPPSIQADVATGKISNRQAEALLPLATLPAEAQQALNSYSDMAAMAEKARSGYPSDKLRDHVQASVLNATKAVADHWRGYDFQGLAGAIQPLCTGCSYIRTVAGEDRCTMPPCWHAKSSAWQAIDNRQIVELTGVPILSKGTAIDYDMLYGSATRLLGIPDIADGPPAHQCPNLRVRQNYNGDWSFCCHYGVSGQRECTCLATARKSADANGKRALKQITSDTEATLTLNLGAFPLAALRLLASKYGKWEQRNQVVTWDADQCTTVIVRGLIRDRMPYEAEKNLASARESMELLLAIAGLRAPWLPIDQEDVPTPQPPAPTSQSPVPTPQPPAPSPRPPAPSPQLEAIEEFLATYVDPGDGLPTLEAMRAAFDDLQAIARAISPLDRAETLRERISAVDLRLCALNDRVYRSHNDD